MFKLNLPKPSISNETLVGAKYYLGRGKYSVSQSGWSSFGLFKAEELVIGEKVTRNIISSDSSRKILEKNVEFYPVYLRNMPDPYYVRASRFKP